MTGHVCGVNRRRIQPEREADVSELCAELKVSRSTFYDWRQKRRGHAASASQWRACASVAVTSTPGWRRRKSRERHPEPTS